jgi:hypothetical protein
MVHRSRPVITTNTYIAPAGTPAPNDPEVPPPPPWQTLTYSAPSEAMLFGASTLLTQPSALLIRHIHNLGRWRTYQWYAADVGRWTFTTSDERFLP